MAKSDPPRSSSKPPVPMLGTDTLLFDPEVRKAVRLALMDVGIRDDELAKLEADVIAECWQDRLYESDPPDTIERWQAFARPRARDMGIERIRKRQTRAEGQAKIALGEVDEPSAEDDDLGLEKQQAHDVVPTTSEPHVKWLVRGGMIAILLAGGLAWLLLRGP